MKKRLLVDQNHLLFRCFFVQKNKILESDFDLLRHIALETIFSNIRRQKPNEVVIAYDGRGNWRREIYPEYKAHRKDNRDKDDIPWDEVFGFFDDFQTELQNFPFKILRLDKTEADDIIATLANRDDEFDENIILSSDKDFKQLLKNPTVKIFDPIKDKFITCNDPEKYLECHVMQGDNSDNIPGFAPRVGEKTAEKFYNNSDKFQEKLDKDEIYEENLARNRAIIDLDRIPKHITEKIIDQYEAYNYSPESSIIRYFAKHQLRNLMKKTSELEMSLKKLDLVE